MIDEKNKTSLNLKFDMWRNVPRKYFYSLNILMFDIKNETPGLCYT